MIPSIRINRTHPASSSSFFILPLSAVCPFVDLQRQAAAGRTNIVDYLAANGRADGFSPQHSYNYTNEPLDWFRNSDGVHNAYSIELHNVFQVRRVRPHTSSRIGPPVCESATASWWSDSVPKFPTLT